MVRCILRYSPQHKSCSSCRLQLYATQIFLSPLFLHFFILEFRNLSVLFSALYLVHPSTLFYSSFCSLFCFLPFCLFTLSSDSFLLISFQICYPFFSFLFPITLFCLLLPYILLIFNLFSFC